MTSFRFLSKKVSLSSFACLLLNTTNVREAKCYTRRVGSSRLLLWDDKWHSSEIKRPDLLYQRTRVEPRAEWTQEPADTMAHTKEMAPLSLTWVLTYIVVNLPWNQQSQLYTCLNKRHWVCYYCCWLWREAELFGTHVVNHPYNRDLQLLLLASSFS